MKLSKFPSKKKLSKFRGNPFKDPWFCIWTHYYPIIVSGTNFQFQFPNHFPLVSHSFPFNSLLHFISPKQILPSLLPPHSHHATPQKLLPFSVLTHFPILESDALKNPTKTHERNRWVWSDPRRELLYQSPIFAKRVGKFVSRWSNDGGDLDARAVPPAKARP